MVGRIPCDSISEAQYHINKIIDYETTGATINYLLIGNYLDSSTWGGDHKEEIKLMYSLIKPKCYVPIHGELFMRMGHAEMIKKIADPGMTITMLENNGDILEIGKQGIRKSKQKIPANDILVDGLGFLILVLVFREPKPTPTDQAMLAWGYLVLFGSVIGFTSFVQVLRLLPMSIAMTYAYVNPVIAVLLGALILGEPITLWTVSGAALVILGVAGVFRDRAIRTRLAA